MQGPREATAVYLGSAVQRLPVEGVPRRRVVEVRTRLIWMLTQGPRDMTSLETLRGPVC